MNVQEAFDTVRDAISEYESAITSKKSELEIINTKIGKATEEHEQIVADIDSTKKKYANEKTHLENAIAPLRKQYTDLKEEINNLKEEKGNLMKDNITAQERHNYLVAYEKKAVKILKAKDEELIRREKEVSEREQMKPLSDSFLPAK